MFPGEPCPVSLPGAALPTRSHPDQQTDVFAPDPPTRPPSAIYSSTCPPSVCPSVRPSLHTPVGGRAGLCRGQGCGWAHCSLTQQAPGTCVLGWVGCTGPGSSPSVLTRGGQLGFRGRCGLEALGCRPGLVRAHWLVGKPEADQAEGGTLPHSAALMPCEGAWSWGPPLKTPHRGLLELRRLQPRLWLQMALDSSPLSVLGPGGPWPLWAPFASWEQHS